MAQTMYSVDPFVDPSLNVELPSCMYRLENIHKKGTITAKEASATLVELARRQESILSELNAIKGRVQDLSRKLDVEVAAQEECRHVVVHASPGNDTRALLVMFRVLSKVVTCRTQVFVHSGLSGEAGEGLSGVLDGVERNEKKVALKVMWIWKQGLQSPEVRTSGQSISGAGVILRYLSRLCANHLYEELGPSSATDIDRWIDTAVVTLHKGNAKEKTAVLRNMNARLGKHDWLSADHLTLSDIVMYSTLDGHKLVDSAQANVKQWLKRCSESLGD